MLSFMDLIKKVTESNNNVNVVYGNSNKELTKGNPVIICFNTVLSETIKNDEAIKRRLIYGFDKRT